MASREKPEPAVATKTVEAASGSGSGGRAGCFALDATLRVLLFSATLVSLVVMVTSPQAVPVAVPGLPFLLNVDAQFTYSPAFIYYVAAMSVACLYSIITTLASLAVLCNPNLAVKFLLHFAFWDTLMLGIVAAATGAAGAVAYIGLRGISNNTWTWTKVCPVFSSFCQHLGGSIFVSLVAAVVLLFLSMLSTLSLYRQVRDYCGD